jgi:hypothetical protein
MGRPLSGRGSVRGIFIALARPESFHGGKRPGVFQGNWVKDPMDP